MKFNRGRNIRRKLQVQNFTKLETISQSLSWKKLSGTSGPESIAARICSDCRKSSYIKEEGSDGIKSMLDAVPASCCAFPHHLQTIVATVAIARSNSVPSVGIAPPRMAGIIIGE